jgi:hypothetical protein
MVNFPQFEVKRADKISTPGMIDAQIINSLLTSDLVIADLTSLNPNAFYEIGIRHMAQKPIIHMQAAEEKIPFDVSLFRSIKYSLLRPRDLRDAQAALRSQIEAVLADGYRVDNPVTRTRGVVEFEKDATSGERVLLDQMRAMDNRLSRLENGVSPPSSLEVPVIELRRKDGLGTNTLTFKRRQGLSPEKIDMIMKTLIAQFGMAAELARSETSLIVAVPAIGDHSRIVFPQTAGMQDVEVIRHTNNS